MEVHELTPERVREEVPENRPGFYRLGHIINGRFLTSYVGRSDTCVRNRLYQHASFGWYTHFKVRPTDSARQAFHSECLFYHLKKEGTTNQVHPARPEGTELQCLYCEFEERLSTALAEKEEFYTNNVA